MISNLQNKQIMLIFYEVFKNYLIYMKNNKIKNDIYYILCKFSIYLKNIYYMLCKFEKKNNI